MTEKDYNPERRNKKVLVKTPKQKIETPKEPLKKEEKVEEKKEQGAESPTSSKQSDDSSAKESKKPIQKKPIVKKTEAVVNGTSLPISTKDSIAICKFIKNKKIQDAIADLEQVVIKKKAVPMKGEIPHRKGKIMAGRFPKNSSEHFIKLLKTLSANSIVNGLENPVIVEAVANKASQPFGKFGRVRKKRTHVKIVAKEKIKEKEK